MKLRVKIQIDKLLKHKSKNLSDDKTEYIDIFKIRRLRVKHLRKLKSDY